MANQNLSPQQFKAHARNVNKFLNRPKGTKKIPQPDVAYASGRALLAHKGKKPSMSKGWTASAMRSDLEKAGLKF